MPQESSKIVDPDKDPKATTEDVPESSGEESGDEGTPAVEGGEEVTQPKKKKSRKRKVKDILKGKGKEPAITDANAPAGHHLSTEQMNMLLEANPALRRQLASQGKGQESIQQLMKNLSVNEMLTGLSEGGKNQKDMASHAFWKTQPVMTFEELVSGKDKIVDGPLKEIDIEKVDKNPSPMYPGYEWVTMDLEDEKQLDQVYDLLTNHYVEDQEAMFRFRYSPSFLNWYVSPKDSIGCVKLTVL
jgi:glycylpeptide N-tetradecanoyltransferase